MSVETNILLVRHGETQWNKESRLQGNKNSSLTPRGVAQANEAKSALEQYVFDRAYVSPLGRARETMEIILGGRDLSADIADNLREINLGPWEGKMLGETALSHPNAHRAFWQKPDLFNLAGAETFQGLQQRVVAELDAIFVKGEGKNILVVSHWIAIKVALAHYLSTSLSHLSSIADPANGGFFRLCKRGNEVFVQQ